MSADDTGDRSGGIAPPQVDHEQVTVEQTTGLHVHQTNPAGSEIFVPPIDEELWVATIAGDVLISALDPRNLERKVESFLSET